MFITSEKGGSIYFNIIIMVWESGFTLIKVMIAVMYANV